MITNAQNPRWSDAAHTRIELVVTHSKHGEIPFSASPNDPEPHGRDLFARAVAGEFGPVAEYVAPVFTDAEFNAKVMQQITALERSNMLPQAVRDYLLDIPGAGARKGFAKVKEVDDAIVALKATLRV